MSSHVLAALSMFLPPFCGWATSAQSHTFPVSLPELLPRVRLVLVRSSLRNTSRHEGWIGLKQKKLPDVDLVMQCRSCQHVCPACTSENHFWLSSAAKIAKKPEQYVQQGRPGKCQCVFFTCLWHGEGQFPLFCQFLQFALCHIQIGKQIRNEVISILIIVLCQIGFACLGWQVEGRQGIEYC